MSQGQVPLEVDQLSAAQSWKGWTVYLAGDLLGTTEQDSERTIKTEWRVDLIDAGKKMKLPVNFTFPVTVEDARTNCGAILSKKEGEKQRAGAKLNAIRTRHLIAHADIVVVAIDGDSHYRQWNATFEAGQAVALGKSLIVLRDENSTDWTREIDAAALAVVHSPEKVVEILTYVISGQVP